jgi:glycosyltransferase involved in cell wall biosynthesis
MKACTDERVRVLLIDSGGGYGGPGAFLCYLLKSLSRDRFAASAVFYFGHTAPEIDELRRLGIPVVFLSKNRRISNFIVSRVLQRKSRWKLLNLVKAVIRHFLLLTLVDAWQLAQLLILLKNQQIDLIVLNNDVHYHRVAAMAAKLTGVPCICRKAGGVGKAPRIKKVLTPWVDLFIAISEATARDQLEKNPASKRVVTVYEGIDLDRFHPESSYSPVRAELGIPPENKIVGYISRVVEGKGHPEFIEAAAIIRERYKNVSFLIVGDNMAGAPGDYQTELQRKVERLGLSDCVILAGWRTDVPEILSTLDVFVHCPTTWIEGLGLAHLEAMAAGKPTVVSENGGLTDAAVDSVTGFIVPPGNVQQLSASILRLLENPEVALQYGRNARRRAEERFDARKNTRELEEYFLEYALRYRQSVKKHTFLDGAAEGRTFRGTT